VNSISILDLLGKTIASISNYSIDDETIRFMLSADMPKGYHFIKLDTDRGVFLEKIMLK